MCKRKICEVVISFWIITLISFNQLFWYFCFHQIISMSHVSLIFRLIDTQYFTNISLSHWSLTLQASRLSTLSLQHDKRLDDESRGGKRKIKLVQERVRNSCHDWICARCMHVKSYRAYAGNLKVLFITTWVIKALSHVFLFCIKVNALFVSWLTVENRGSQFF